MTMKRIAVLALVLILALGALPTALATPSTAGCPKSQDGNHGWMPRPRDAWCEWSGGMVYVCRYCGKEAFEETTPALGHNWSEWTVTKQATCSEQGSRTHYCRRCQKTETQSIPTTGHAYGPWEVTTPATCEQEGVQTHKCANCGRTETKPAPALGHDWDEGKVTKAPTATEDGEMTYTCKNDPSHTKTEVIPATGGEVPQEDKPALTLAWTDGKTDPGIKVFGDNVKADFEIDNTGNVDLKVTLFMDEFLYGKAKTQETNYPGIFTPGFSYKAFGNFTDIGDFITPGTETEELIGTATISYYAIGYDPNTGSELCKSNTISRTWKVAKEDGPHPKLTLTASWADDAGEGKCYEGAEVEFTLHLTNSGDCPVTVDESWKVIKVTGPSGESSGSANIELQPQESADYVIRDTIIAIDVEQEEYHEGRRIYGFYTDKDGQKAKVKSNTAIIRIPLTYPDGEEPEEKKPGLTIEWKYDCIFFQGVDEFESTTDPGVLAPDACPSVMYYCINSGNVPLIIDLYKIRDIGTTISKGVVAHEPGFKTQCDLGYKPVKNHITPGTETEDLLGTATISVYAIGRDPETGEELCKSNTLTRTWKVGKDSPWPIPEESKLAGTLTVAPGYESSDPAGYVLGEEIETVLTVKNTGLIDLDTFGVSDPWDSTNFSDGPIAVNGVKSYVRAHVTVTKDDVEKGYIEFPMITITWTDPDSGKDRTAFAGPLTVPVLKKTGLLLKKGVAFGPAEGEYFKEGEPIQWSLTVTNNSKESIKDVTVEDQGKNVGSYAEIVPADTKNCTVPVHIVTEYEAKVVGYVLNSATATGTDYRGATHTWPSNVAKALTKKVDPDGDPKGDIDGLHPAVTIVKAEVPGPLNGSYYEPNETINYTITIKNVGDTELKDIRITDSLAGFAPIGTLSSLAPSGEKTFNYSYTVKESDIGWVTNTAVINYTFGDNVSGTPKSSTVQSMVGDGDPIPHLDPELLPGNDDYCSLTLDSLGETEARYTLHACAEHAEAARSAEQAALDGDWAKAAEIWKAETDKLYEVLYAAADSELKGAAVAEKAAYDDYVNSLQALSAEAAANELRVRCAFLCCALHTTPEDQPGSLTGDYAWGIDIDDAAVTARVFGMLAGSDSEVTETYAGPAAYAQKNVRALMDIEKSYDWDQVFERGAQLWQTALDNDVNAAYKAADKEARRKIAFWRISLDTLKAAEEPFLKLLYEGNDNAVRETLMNLYKDAAMYVEKIR